MALGNTATFEVRPTGNDTNGGAWVRGTSGSDYSQQDGKRTAGDVTDISTTDAVSNGTTTLTSATANFATTIIGSVIYLAGGSGSLVATRRQVTARASATSITVDATVASGTGITMNIGGALLTPDTALTFAVGGNGIWVKKGVSAYITAGLVFGVTQVAMVGYDVTRGDGGQPTIQVSGAANVVTLTGTASGIRNFILDANNQGVSCIAGAGAQCYAHNIRGINYGGTGVGNCFAHTGNPTEYKRCVAASPKAGSTAHGWTMTLGILEDCVSDGPTGDGFRANNSPSTFIRCIARNTTSSGKGFQDISRSSLRFCIADNCDSDGIHLSTVGVGGKASARNCIVRNAQGSGKGFNIITNVTSVDADYNAFYNNGGGSYGVGNPSWTGVHDVALSADPFIDAANGDYRLNNAAGGGALLRASGDYGAFPGLASSISYPDIGALVGPALIPRSRAFTGY